MAFYFCQLYIFLNVIQKWSEIKMIFRIFIYIEWFRPIREKLISAQPIGDERLEPQFSDTRHEILK